jgi:hypothetical protein
MNDLEKTQRDYACFLPAISSFYVKQYDDITNPKKKKKAARVPAGFEKGNAGLNFLDPDGYFYYPWGLYSAGHAQLDLKKTNNAEPMIQKRDRSRNVILGDSGGFQVATGVIKMDWENAQNPNDPAREELCEKILRWLEHTADWSMTLDVPAAACVPPFNKKTKLTDFQSAMNITVLNLDYFLRNRVPGATKFLNVFGGNDEESSDLWYDQVKMFSDPQFIKEVYGDENRTLEGFAFGGINKSNMYLSLKRILMMREDGILKDKGWIHFLGTGKLNWACYLTSIQRMLRKHDSENITLSFDAASPFINTAYGQTYSHNFFAPKKFGYFMNRAFDNQALKESNLPMPFGGPIMSRLTIGDICTMAEGDLDKNGKPKTAKSTSWDTQTYLYYMAHSVYNHIAAVQEANRLADLEKHRIKLHWRDWIADKKTSVTNEFSPYVPHHVVFFDSFAQEVLDPACPNPFELLDENRSFLELISFGDMDTGKSLTQTFFEERDIPEEQDYINFEDVFKGDE